MKYELISISLEQAIRNELNELFESDVIEKILRTAKVERNENILKNMQEGNSFKITERLSPELFAICQEVKNCLEYEENIDFFIMNSPETNAFAVPKMEDEDVNMVIITSALLEKLDVTELKFIIGHEIGHLISQTSKLENIIRFVFSDKESVPIVLNNKIELWKKLAELTADRFGFLAAKDFDKVVTLFFKLASGLSK